MAIDELRQKYKDDRFWDEVFNGEYAEMMDLPNPKVLIDIGALSGEVGWWFYDKVEKIYAIEPHGDSFKELVKNINDYDKDYKFRAYNIALGAEDTYRKLEIKNRGGHVLASEPREFEAVEVQTLPSFLTRHKIDKCDIVKFDVEGAEGEIFKSFDQIAPKIRMVIGETHDHWLDFLFDTFKNCGFNITVRNKIIIGRRND